MKFSFFTILTFLFLLSFIPSMIKAEERIIFPEIKFWKLGEIKTWNADNLYKPINGAADMFLAYNFEVMKAVDYSSGNNYIRVEVYQHRTTIDAFGAYSQERPDRDIYFDLGVQAYREEDYINFVAGTSYIKIRTSEATEKSREAMLLIAEKQAEILNGNAVFPVLYSVFPAEDRVPFSERYINENLLGFPFLHSSYEVNYLHDEQEYTLFILKGDNEDDAESMLHEYLEFLKLSMDDPQDGFYLIQDMYSGTICVQKCGNYLICSRGAITEDKSRILLQGIKETLLNPENN